jgi:hypothetical protein
MQELRHSRSSERKVKAIRAERHGVALSMLFPCQFGMDRSSDSVTNFAAALGFSGTSLLVAALNAMRTALADFACNCLIQHRFVKLQCHKP